jgi:hypothetical protein
MRKDCVPTGIFQLNAVSEQEIDSQIDGMDAQVEALKE